MTVPKCPVPDRTLAVDLSWGFDTTGVGNGDGDEAIDILFTSESCAISGGHSGRLFALAGETGRE
jgi:hypothetical protein